MKNLLLPCLAVALLGLSGCATWNCCSGDSSCAMTKPTISRQAAEKAALAKVPGTVKEVELETEKGKTYWSVEILPTGGKKLTEVAVDATTGKVVWTGDEDSDG